MADTAPAPAPADPVPPASTPLLDRPDTQRLQEFKYRLGQAAVFGLPVLALEGFGRSLGGVDSDRWVFLLQSLLAGWVVYVAAAGMLAEAILLLAGRRLCGHVFANGLVAVLALLAYLLGLVWGIASLARNGGIWLHWRGFFSWAVVIVAAWSAIQLWRMRKRVRS
jgi:hypothetical protein